MKNNFDEAEEKGRKLFAEHFKPYWLTIAWGTTPMPFDALMYTQDKRLFPIEIKKRDFGFGKYPDYYLEVAKADSLFNVINNNKDKHYDGALYINVLDDKLLIWDITKFNLGKSSWEDCPETTVDGKKKYVKKLCYRLKPENAEWTINI